MLFLCCPLFFECFLIVLYCPMVLVVVVAMVVATVVAVALVTAAGGGKFGERAAGQQGSAPRRYAEGPGAALPGCPC